MSGITTTELGLLMGVSVPLGPTSVGVEGGGGGSKEDLVVGGLVADVDVVGAPGALDSLIRRRCSG